VHENRVSQVLNSLISNGMLHKDVLFVCLFVDGVSKAGEIRTLPKPSLPVAMLRVAKT
jgi:hypothetical protein